MSATNDATSESGSTTEISEANRQLAEMVQEHQRELDELRTIFPVGSTARTILRHVSASGMTRWISVVAPTAEEVTDVTYMVARVLGEKIDRRHDGIKVGGCGMDMGFDLVYRMSRKLYPHGFECIGRDSEARVFCPANDHANGDRDYTPHHHAHAGGYAVSQRWL